MNISPKESRNYAKALDSNRKKNKGTMHYINGQWHTVKEIASMINKNVDWTRCQLRTYTAEKLIAKHK